jgi:hypothetical protein
VADNASSSRRRRGGKYRERGEEEVLRLSLIILLKSDILKSLKRL